jgi:pilus assembly protein Flp/PilA
MRQVFIKPKNKEIGIMEKLINFFKDEEGATAVEYGIMVAAIAAIIITIVISIGEEIQSAFETVNTELGNLGS